MAVVAVVIITRGVMAVAMAVVVAAVVIAPGKGSGEKTLKNPPHGEKGESPRGSQRKKEHK